MTQTKTKLKAENAADPQLKSLTLDELQTLFQRAVVEGDDTLFPYIRDNSRTGRETLLGVYRHAYVARLIGIVREDHKWLAAYIGDDAFDVMARAYIAAHPSHSPSARWVSKHLPEFLSGSTPYREHVQLSELAALERALNNAFDAEDAQAGTVEDMKTFPAERWGDLRFEFHPSIARLSNKTNALALWMALKEDAEPPAVERLAEPQHIIVWREGMMPKVRGMVREEAMIWDEAAAGLKFGALCEMLAVYDDPETAPLRAATYLKSWVERGMISAISLASPAAARSSAASATGRLKNC